MFTDGSTENINVTWNESQYNPSPSTSKNEVIYGTLEDLPYIENPNNVNVYLVVRIVVVPTVKFNTLDDSTISAEIDIAKTVAPTDNDISFYVAYTQNGALKHIDKPTVTDMTANFAVPQEYNDCEISVYVWDKDMKPLMEVQKVD